MCNRFLSHNQYHNQYHNHNQRQVENAEPVALFEEHEEFKQLHPYMSKTMETNPEEPTVVPVQENDVKEDQVVETSSLDRVKGWWGGYQQFVAGAVFGGAVILLGSFLRVRRN